MKFFTATAFLLVLSFAGLAQTKVVPIIEMKIGGLLGGVENGKFIDAKTTAARLAAEQNYTLYLFGGTTESLKLKKPTTSMDVCEDFFALEYSEEDGEKRYEKGGVALGEGFRWNPLPRSSKTIDLNNAEYKKIINDFLRTKRITSPVQKLNQAVRVDLDGDGQEEVVLTASRIISYENRKANTAYDEYSVVLIRKIVGGKPQNIIVEGEFYPKSRYEFEGYEYKVSAIADLNGDGKMELVVHGQYYEGAATAVFEVTGNKAVAVDTLTVGCGV